MHDIPLTETDFHVTVTVLDSNRLPMVQGLGPLTSWYRVEDGTEQNTQCSNSDEKALRTLQFTGYKSTCTHVCTDFILTQPSS